MKLILSILLISNCIFAITPSDVYKEANSIKLALAKSVNEKIGDTLLPIIDIDLKGSKPHHVFSLTTALNEKIRVYMIQNSIDGFKSFSYPNEKVTPAHVYKLMQIVQENIKLAIPNSSFYKTEASNKTPADVMIEITFANLWMDKLLKGKIKPSYPYWITLKIENSLKNIAEKLNIKTSNAENCFNYKSINPKKVFLNASIFYQKLSLHDELLNGNTNPSTPYDILSSGVKVSPADVFTLSVFILNYLKSFEYSLGIEVDSNNSLNISQNRKPLDVYQRYENLNFILNEIINKTGAKSCKN